jgi:hypothetical protein
MESSLSSLEGRGPSPSAGETRYVQSQAVVSRVIGGETLVVPVRGGVGDLASIYTFNETGTFLWEALSEAASARELACRIEREYEINPQVAQADVKSFLSEMCAVGLIDQAEGAEDSVGRGLDQPEHEGVAT